MKRTLLTLVVMAAFGFQTSAQKIARSYIGAVGSSHTDKFHVLAFTPISSPVDQVTFRDGRSIQTKPFIHLVSSSRFDDIQVQIYPNPTQNWINIKTEATYTSVTIIDVFGKMCYNGWSDRISMHELASGVYTINLTLTDMRVYSQKLILIK
jgi:hypothetical protein